MEDNVVYVAVGKDVEDRNSTLKWALKRFKFEKSHSICVFYVHTPAQMVTLPNGFEAPVNSVKEYDIESFREREKQEVAKILSDCRTMCNAYKVPFQTIQVQNESITDGILELIGLLRIQKLVMGAAANSTYSRIMSIPTSKKAMFVLRSAPNFCHMWFVCSNHLIFTRDGWLRQIAGKVARIQLNRSSYPENLLDSLPSSPASGSSPQHLDIHHGSSPTITMPASIIDKLYAQLQQTQNESKESTKELHTELKRRREAEKEALEANLMLQQTRKESKEKLQREFETRQQVEKEASEAKLKVQVAEKNLAQMKELLNDTKIQLDKTLDKLSNASSQLISFETQNESWHVKVKEMEKKLESSEKSRNKYKKLSDSLQRKLNDALYVTHGSTNHIAGEQLRLEISLLDLDEATNCFDPALKIGEGGYGYVHRGFLNHTDVAIKILHPNSLQGLSEFKQEVDVLSKVRHRNLVTLIGTCTKARGLIYEHLPNGTLQDRLSCKDNTPPLSWQTRIQIAIELCSLLIYLHSREPYSIVHADINPKNVLLDANFICKLSGFGSPHTRHMTPKDDVYSFGKILLCLLTADSPSGIDIKMKDALENDDLRNILDHSAGQWPFVRATQLAHMALRCCHMLPDCRPDLASEVWRVLKPSNDPSQNSSNPIWLISEDRIPSYFICPILQEIMQDPHFAADGFTYEASAIKAWFEGGHETSPMTNLRLVNCHLTPNHALRSTIEEWKQKNQCV